MQAKLINHFSGYNSEAKNTFLKTALVYKDKPSNCRIVAADTDASSGYQLRKNHVQKSQICPFVTSFHVDFLNSSRWIPPGKAKIEKNRFNIFFSFTRGIIIQPQLK